MSIKLNSVGGGSVTIQEPNTASDFTLSVPARTGTTVLQDGSNNLLMNSGYGSDAVAYGCRAWVNFNGQGTIAIRGSGNVSSITDNGTGNYIVNFTNALPDTNYTTNITLGGGNAYIGTTETRNTGSVLIYGWNDASAHFDSNSVGVAVFR